MGFFGEGPGIIYVIYFTIPSFIFGLVLTIFWLYCVIKDYQEINLKKLNINLKRLGTISIIYGFFSFISFVSVFLLIISGIFMIYFGSKEEKYFDSSLYNLDLVIFLLLTILIFFFHYANLLITELMSEPHYIN